MTLIGVAVAGFLMWLGIRIVIVSEFDSKRYWAYVGLFALAGFVMALSQLLGGWTKWGWPRISVQVLLIAFVPTLFAGGWVLAATAGSGWVPSHVRSWSDDIGIVSVIRRLVAAGPAIAFLIGLVFGFSFDTTGPRPKRAAGEGDKRGAEKPPEDDRRVRIREGGEPIEPTPEPPPRSGEPPKE